MNRLTRRYRVLNKNYEFLEELEKETKEIQIDAIKEFNVFFAKWRSENDDIWNALPTKHQKKKSSLKIRIHEQRNRRRVKQSLQRSSETNSS